MVKYIISTANTELFYDQPRGEPKIGASLSQHYSRPITGPQVVAASR